MGVICAEYFNRMALEGGRMSGALIVYLSPLLGHLAGKEGLGSDIILITVTSPSSLTFLACRLHARTLANEHLICIVLFSQEN